jgi:hypothetical protein
VTCNTAVRKRDAVLAADRDGTTDSDDARVAARVREDERDGVTVSEAVRVFAVLDDLYAAAMAAQ